MFAFKTHPSFRTRVEVALPDGTKEDFTARFICLPIDEYEGFDLSSPEGAGDFVRRVLDDASEITDPDGTPLGFDDSLKERMVNVSYVRLALIAAYHQALSGN